MIVPTLPLCSSSLLTSRDWKSKNMSEKVSHVSKGISKTCQQRYREDYSAGMQVCLPWLLQCDFQSVDCTVSYVCCGFCSIAHIVFLTQCRICSVASTVSYLQCGFSGVASSVSLLLFRLHSVVCTLWLVQCGFYSTATTRSLFCQHNPRISTDFVLMSWPEGEQYFLTLWKAIQKEKEGTAWSEEVKCPYHHIILASRCANHRNL